MVVSEARAEIEALIPHRDPFLFVEAIEEFEDGHIITRWSVEPDFFAFRGHYPGEPVLPGVLISEFTFQSGALMLNKMSEKDRLTEGIPVLAKIQAARFKRVVRPGDVLHAEVRLDRSLANARYLKGKVTTDGQLVARMEFVLAIAPAGGSQ